MAGDPFLFRSKMCIFYLVLRAPSHIPPMEKQLLCSFHDVWVACMLQLIGLISHGAKRGHLTPLAKAYIER